MPTEHFVYFYFTIIIFRMDKNLDNLLIDSSWAPCDLKDTKNIDEKYICPKCKSLMVNVHQADDCGCRYCLDCLDQM